MKKITPIILSGGIGSRLWPLSTKNLPKQFLKLPFKSPQTLFEQTLVGIKNRKVFSEPIIICSEQHKFLILESLNKLKIKFSDIIVEKISKNTAPSILLSIYHSLNKDKSNLSLVIPSDHYIPNRDYSILIPPNVESLNSHIIYGIKPDFESTDYGYIYFKNNSGKIKKVKKFFEKPSLANVKKYISQGFYWNSGIFLINNKKVIEDFKKFNPKLLKLCKKIISNLSKDLEFLETKYEFMNKLPELSFDKAILEKCESIYMLKFNQKWRDIGSWKTLTELSDQNQKLNSNTTIYNNSLNSNVISDKKNTVLNDVNDIIVISKNDSIYVSSKKNVNKIKDIINDKHNKNILNSQNIFYKPWGHYEIFINSKNYLVKKLTVKPDHRLSLQFHKHRSEHWVVVEGIAQITKGRTKTILKKNQSTYIPVGQVHCINNIGKKKLEIIEIQIGEILEETDIIRLDDPYKRN